MGAQALSAKALLGSGGDARKNTDVTEVWFCLVCGFMRLFFIENDIVPTFVLHILYICL